MIKKQIKFLFFLIIYNGAFAQSDFRDAYVLRTKNDTIYGQINYKSDK